ncbi:unnamed protein product [Moneuplotes crassus]|uniref:RRM domain-containing protein n=1 Tax=Euplotes crassus TaxID=5936 RepID=A0AAD1X4H5_EUPCR|nr:unnamed protein product [Moneuplotes crassus]
MENVEGLGLRPIQPNKNRKNKIFYKDKPHNNQIQRNKRGKYDRKNTGSNTNRHQSSHRNQGYRGRRRPSRKHEDKSRNHYYSKDSDSRTNDTGDFETNSQPLLKQILETSMMVKDESSADTQFSQNFKQEMPKPLYENSQFKGDFHWDQRNNSGIKNEHPFSEDFSQRKPLHQSVRVKPEGFANINSRYHEERVFKKEFHQRETSGNISPYPDKFQRKKRVSNWRKRDQKKPNFRFKENQIDFDEYIPIDVGYKDGKGVSYHDKALARADKAEYTPPPGRQENAHKTLFVKGFSPQTIEEDLFKAFKPFGKINDIALIRDIVTKNSKCYGFIQFDEFNQAKKAFDAGNDIKVGSRYVLVDFVRAGIQKNWKPRRLGGGYGGKIKSSQIRFGGRDRPFGIQGDMLKTVQVANNDLGIVINPTSMTENNYPNDKKEYGRLGKNVFTNSQIDQSNKMKYLLKDFDDAKFQNIGVARPMNLF